MDFEDTMDSYHKVLEVVGEICGEIIDANAEQVDQTDGKERAGHLRRGDEREPRHAEKGRIVGDGVEAASMAGSTSRWFPT